MIRAKELGKIDSESGKLLLLSKEVMQTICDKLNINFFEFCQDNEVVLLDMKCRDIVVGVDMTEAIHKDGLVYSAPIIGIEPENFIGFLNDRQMVFQDFSKQHKLYKQELDDMTICMICEDYRNYVLGKKAADNDPRPNPELDKALGII
jgi:hypothetical protein